ncbi:FkbM family methyltransferase [Candidatus Pelagibacter sp.]|uniref:FkbM family methyltransferase n=1 Tax=Candidatus Pelagibacter sp. TaxID=2024849 RepID=UPI003F82C344
MNIYFYFKKIFNFKIPSFLKKKLKKNFGKNNLDLKLEKYLNFFDGFYVELGAHDGITQSNTYYYEKNKNWKGILIEPTPKLFKECKHNRSQRNLFFCNACVSFNFTKKNVELIYSNLKTTSIDQTSKSFREDHLSTPELNFFEKQTTFLAEARTLDSILYEANAPKKINFLSLDVEGAEFEVLNGINFNNFSFQYLIVETHKFEKLNEFLKQKNYIFIEKFNFNDYLFKYLK